MMPTRVIGPIAAVAALLSALMTFLVLAKLTFVSLTPNVVVILLAVNFIIVLLLLAIIGREIWHIVQARERGARLHVQITALFSVVAVVPVVLVAVIASVNLDRGLDRQFLIRTRPVMENSAIVSEAYLNEYKRSIQTETAFMAADVARARRQFDQDIDRFNRQFFTTQALLRGMPVAMMLRPDQSIILRADIRLPPEVQEPPLPPIERLAQIGERLGDAGAVPDMLGDTNYIGGFVKLKNYDDAYLFVARFINRAVLEQVRKTEDSIRGYANLEARRIGVQLASALMYAVIALTVLLLAVRIGFGLANTTVSAVR
jgi:two-component system, NtrC family, nitrogen regulation sensor histidine kinase NtrY